MTDEKKKKGFWSWLGFGKKEQQTEERQHEEPAADQVQAEQTQDVVDTQQAVGSEPQNAKSEQALASAESLEEVIDSVKEKTENYVEQVKVQAESFADKAEAFVEQLEDNVEQKIDTLEDTFESVKETVEEKTEALKETLAQKFDELKESAEEQLETFKDIAEQKFDTFKETVEQNVEVIQQTAEQKIDNIKEIIEEKVEQVEAFFDKPHAEEQSDDDRFDEFAEGETEDALDAEENADTQAPYQEKPSEGGFFSRLIKGLIKTKESIGSGFRNFFRGKKIDDDLFEELEEQLLVADLGMPTTTKIINNLTQHATKQQLRDAELLYQQLKVELGEVLKPVAKPLVLDDKKPYVILMVGVNGVGKTTTIGKLARKFQAEGKSVMLAAGDTFRAAAVEQLQVWGERNNIPVVAQSSGSDSASVIFDAMQSAAAKGIDVLIADTAGRLQNKNNLMDELKKIVRVMKKYDETAPHEIMLTLDAGTGQNAISQAKLFNEAVGLTGITLTKLDGTAKGGVIFAIADQFNIPIRYIGVGEKIDDLRPFNAEEFIEALFAHEEEK
ncbi:signal recognition particle-docking protein FtsY [Glaesserella sp.]|uniref:signal recognition particle-docking protein FtsY n=1 Tax=Glaesserella sp. TaxID=2094731 RepID=UPI0035A07BEB